MDQYLLVYFAGEWAVDHVVGGEEEAIQQAKKLTEQFSTLMLMPVPVVNVVKIIKQVT